MFSSQLELEKATRRSMIDKAQKLFEESRQSGLLGDQKVFKRKWAWTCGVKS